LIDWNGSVLAKRSGITISAGGPILARQFSTRPNGRASRMVNRRSSGAVISAMRASKACPIGSRAAQRLIEATQSRPRTGSPSVKRKLSRRVNVQRRPSSSVVWPSTICGRGWSALSMP
jgi:hypothetical protein